MSPNDIMTATEWGRLMTDASAGLVGGSMGVMGTLAVYENNRFHAKQRSICAYCEGTGFIKGASYQSSTGDWLRKADGVCINCEGTGLSIPATLDRKGIKQQDDELETKLDEIGIAALADDIVRAENSPGDMLELTRMLQRRALARAGQKKPLTEAENVDKFRRCCGHGARSLPASGIGALIETIGAIEDEPDVARLARLTLAAPAD